MAKRRGDRLIAPRAIPTARSRALSPYRFQVEKPETLPSFQLARGSEGIATTGRLIFAGAASVFEGARAIDGIAVTTPFQERLVGG